MHHYYAHYHPAMCNPWAMYYHPGYVWAHIHSHFLAHYCCPACHQPFHFCSCVPKTQFQVAQELSVDTSNSPKEALIGGLCNSCLTLEYMPTEGATSPAIKITFTGPDGTSTWEESSIPAGFHVKSDFSTVSPGTKVKIEVTDVIARLRWCETICC